MVLATEIPVKRVYRSRITEADFNDLEFGKYISDHMLVCDFKNGDWGQPSIVPFSNLSVSPASLALHYGQTVFEGMKAFRMKDGRINIFRLRKHYDRFVRSLERMCMAAPSFEMFTSGMAKLISTDRAWVPRQKGSSLYIRPFIFATEARFGVKISEEYRFIIITGPVPELYSRPISVKVETNFVRAIKGGTGFAKCGGNYGAAFYPTKLAREKGYDQVLWTDGKENKYVEESGTMNVMFVINNKLITPPLSDSILDGVTRDSLLILANDLGYEVVEKPVSVEELKSSFDENIITEAFGAGTAAVVAPINKIGIGDEDFFLPPYDEQSLLNKIKLKLEMIRTGRREDKYEWNYVID